MERVVFERMAEMAQVHWWFVARRRILASLIKRSVRLPKDARILDVGCGTGHNLAMLGRFGVVEACEMDPIARDLASLHLGRPVLDARLPELTPVPASRYDLITLLDVLEHVEDDVSALKAIRSRLKSNGTLLLTVPANQWMWGAHDIAHHHHRRYSKESLGRVFAEAGFATQLHSRFNSLLFVPIAAARVAGKLLGRDASDDSLPRPRLNALLTWVFGLEASLIGRVGIPAGVSLIAILRPTPALVLSASTT